MKIMTRSFTLAEKILLLVLSLFLIGLTYYNLVEKPVRKALAAEEQEAKEIQIELNAAEQRLAYLKSVQSSMDGMETTGNLSWMGSYNNSKEELDFLNEVLKSALDYTITFANVTRDGDQIRRSFNLQFRTADYDDAQTIMFKLAQCPNRCLIQDMRCSIDQNGYVTISASAVFFETMVGGIPDAALPEDSAAAKK